MAMMARMRSLAPWFILMVGGLFVLFMVISDSRVLEFLGQQSQNVGSINGESISYQEFSNMVERARQNQEQATGQSIDENQMDFFRDQVWDALVTQKLIDEKIKEFGIVVTDDEVREALLGPNPPAELRQQFTDTTGNFNRQLYEQAMRDPRNKEIVLYYEDLIREQLKQRKLQDYLFASLIVSEQEIKDAFIKQNIKMKADYIQLNPNLIPDKDVKVTDQELRDYYEQNKKEFKVEPARKIKYVLFRRVPSRQDSLGIKNNLEAIVAKLKGDTASFKSYVDIYSDLPYSKDTVSLTSIPAEAQNLIYNSNVGDIIGPVATSQGYIVYRIVEKINSSNPTVRASHILVRSSSNDAEDLKKANEIYNQLMNGADFASLAKEKSQDPGSAFRGGDLGWFGKGQMVKEFEDACFKGQVGVVQKPIKTNYGYHIIKVTGKTNTEYVIEKIVNRIQMSASSLDDLYQSASDFSYIAKENGFESEAKLMNYNVVETPPFYEGSQFIPGLGGNKALVKWAFENNVGEISDVYKVPAGYVVAMVSDKIKAGFKEFDEVKDIVRNRVLREKKFNKAIAIAEKIRARLGDNGNAEVAMEVWGGVRIDTTGEFTAASIIPNVGQEYTFTEYCLKGDLNKWSNPIKGSNGVYLINLRYRTKFVPETYQLQKNGLAIQLLNRKKNTLLSQWIQKLKDEADIVDNRHLFFR
ncbi:peptidylprolyl isomerase [Melioribacter sp. OK-6-Me]|uniref:peptidylprolyl isomerase n=1 Tax=unclassified Melioribacter TaxID=2627329 RepID=UPI003ED8A7D0